MFLSKRLLFLALQFANEYTCQRNSSFSSSKEIMFTVTHARFPKLAAQTDVGGFEGCLSGSLRELYVFGKAAEAQIECARGVHHATCPQLKEGAGD